MGSTALNKSEIEKLALIDPTIANCFKSGELGGLSYVENLECMVLLLALDKKNLTEQLIKTEQEKLLR